MMHTFHMLLKDETGVLARVTTVMAQRSVQIESLAVHATQDPGVSEMTVSIKGGDLPVRKLMNLLSEMDDVISLRAVSEEESGDFVTAQINAIFI